MSEYLQFPPQERIHAFLDIHPHSVAFHYKHISISGVAAKRFANKHIIPENIQREVSLIVNSMADTIPDWIRPTISKRLTVALVDCAGAYMGIKAWSKLINETHT